MTNETRPCLITLGGIKQKGTFHGIYQYSKTHGASALVGGFSAGTDAYPVAIVEVSGELKEVRVSSVFFTDVSVGGDKNEIN